jgi:hypothetical protein
LGSGKSCGTGNCFWNWKIGVKCKIAREWEIGGELLGIGKFLGNRRDNCGKYGYVLKIKNDAFPTDKFSCLEANIHLSRQIGYHLVQSYIPTGLIVIISWVSFWIDRRAVPARVTLSFTTLLSLSTLV